MHTHKDFDYDLWKTKENNTVHYWARVKRTGEVTEVNKEVYDFLSSENNKIGYEQRVAEHPLSLSECTDEGNNLCWLADPYRMEEALEVKELVRDFLKTLTDKQRDLFTECVINGKSQAEYANEHHLFFTTVNQRLMAIRKKFEIFYGDTRRNT